MTPDNRHHQASSQFQLFCQQSIPSVPQISLPPHFMISSSLATPKSPPPNPKKASNEARFFTPNSSNLLPRSNSGEKKMIYACRNPPHDGWYVWRAVGLCRVMFSPLSLMSGMKMTKHLILPSRRCVRGKRVTEFGTDFVLPRCSVYGSSRTHCVRYK